MAKYEKLANVTTESLRKHTGKTWDQWIELLNKDGAKNWSYQDTTAYLGRKHAVSIWWRQWITIGYETAIGKRMPGRTLKGDYSIVVTRTLHQDHKKIWKLLSSEKGLSLWLRPLTPLKLQIGQSFETETGAFGEIRTLLAPRRVRLTWKEVDWEKPTTVQVFLVPRANGSTILAFQHEKLRDGRLREPLRDYWSQIAEEFIALSLRNTKR